MGQNQYTLKLPEERQDQRWRDQLFEGCRLARQLDERMRSIPPGKLGDPTSTQLRCSLAIASAETISAFNEAIKLLLTSTNYPSDSALITGTNSPRQCIDAQLPSRKRAFNSALRRGIAPEQGPNKRVSPPLSPHGLTVVTANANNNNVGSINSKRVAPSPALTPSPARSINSPISEMSDGSPNNDAAETAETAEDTTTTTNAKGNPRKRKLLPKVSLKMPAGNLDQGGDSTPPDDGHTWRKYGQKEILGARFPRSYYRCTHKTDLDCPAIKQVQRCDEDCSVFDVTYWGQHTCRSAELEKQFWPFAFHHSLFPFLASHQFSLLPNFSHMPGVAQELALPTINNIAPALEPFRQAALDSSFVFTRPYSNYQSTSQYLPAGIFGRKHESSLSSLLQPKTSRKSLEVGETRKIPEGPGEPTSAEDSSANDVSFALQLSIPMDIVGPNEEKEIFGSRQPVAQSRSFTPVEDWPLFKHTGPSLTISEAMASPHAATTEPLRNHRSFGEALVSQEHTLSPNDQPDQVSNSLAFDNIDLIGFLESIDSDPVP